MPSVLPLPQARSPRRRSRHAVQPPSAPTGLTMSARTTRGAFTIAWTDSSSNEDGFYIERSSDGRSFTQIAQVAQEM